MWKREVAPDAETLATQPLSPRIVAHELQRLGVQAGAAERVLAVEPGVERFARAAGSASSDTDKAAKLIAALRTRAARQAFVAWSLGEPREGPSLVAGEVAATIDKDGARRS